MSFCPVIEIFPDSTFYFATGDGRIILDIDAGTGVSLSKALKVQDDAFTIGSIDDLHLTIPASPKNFLYLKHLFDPAVEVETPLHLVVRISLGSETLYHDRLYVISKSAQQIEIKLVYGANWKKRLQELYIKDLPLGGFWLTIPHLEFIKTNNALYNDGDPGYWFPDVDFGGWRERGKIVAEDNRPFLHSLFVMQKMFEHINWCLEFPFYETELGRRCIDYILKDDYGNDIPKYKREFVAVKEYTPNTVVDFDGVTAIGAWDELSDYANSFSEGVGHYINVFEGKFKLRVQHTGAGTGFTIVLRLIKRRFNAGIDEVSELWQHTLSLTGNGNHTFEIETTVTPSEIVFLTLQSDIVIMPVALTITFSNEVVRTFYAKGDYIDLQNVVDQSLTCYDYLMGNLHFCAGIIEEFPQYKKVRILTPHDADIFGDSIEGYFVNAFETLRTKQPIDTTNSVVRNDGQLRYLKVAFKESTDAQSEDIPTDHNEPFSKTHDLGEPYIEDVEELRNPLFEYTLLKDENNFVFPGNSSFGSPGYYKTPQLTDNIDGEVSLKIAPRKLIAHGYDRVDNVANGLIVWENNLIVEFAFASQDPTGILFGTPGVALEHKLIYGDNTNDLWSLVLARFYLQFRQRLQLDFLVYLTNEQFFSFNNRNKFEIEYDGHPIVGRIVSINDYQPCNVISAQGILMPELKAGEICFESEEVPICTNDPIIIETFNAETNCWTFAIGGSFNCPVTGIIWLIQYESDDPSLWTEIGTGSTVEVCDAVEWFIIRAQVTLDCPGCPDFFDITLYVEPCTQTIECDLTWIYNPDEFQPYVAYRILGDQPSSLCSIVATLVIRVDGVITDTIVSDSAGSFGEGFYNYNGVTWVWITPMQFGDNIFYELTVVVDCDNGCPDLETTCTLIGNSSPPPPNACDVTPGLVCVPVTVNGVTCYTWILENAGDYQYFIVSWECDNGTSGQWMPGDAPVCCSGFLEANAMVHYCNCDPICTDYISCDPGGCTVVSAGTALQLIVCN